MYTPHREKENEVPSSSLLAESSFLQSLLSDQMSSLLLDQMWNTSTGTATPPPHVFEVLVGPT